MARRLKVIVVEDDPILCEAFASTLEKDPLIKTAQAHTLVDAVHLCQMEPQVVLLLDLSVPGVKDVEIVETLRKETPGAIIIVVTGHEKLADAAMQAGASKVIIKGSNESWGPGLIKAFRDTVTAREVELLFAPTRDILEKQKKTLTSVTPSIQHLVNNQK